MPTLLGYMIALTPSNRIYITQPSQLLKPLKPKSFISLNANSTAEMSSFESTMKIYRSRWSAGRPHSAERPYQELLRNLDSADNAGSAGRLPQTK